MSLRINSTNTNSVNSTRDENRGTSTKSNPSSKVTDIYRESERNRSSTPDSFTTTEDRSWKFGDTKLKLTPEYAGEKASLDYSIIDNSGNNLTAYHEDHELIRGRDLEKLKNPTLSSEEKILILSRAHIHLSVYFSKESLRTLTVPNRDLEIYELSDLKNLKSIFIKNEEQENVTEYCIIIQSQNIYIHPYAKEPFLDEDDKVITYIIVGHGSLSGGEDVNFAGRLIKNEDRFILSNQSGHYKPPATTLSLALQTFIEQNISLDNLDLKYIFPVEKQLNKELFSLKEKLNFYFPEIPEQLEVESDTTFVTKTIPASLAFDTLYEC
jgi:hypothetical protein